MVISLNFVKVALPEQVVEIVDPVLVLEKLEVETNSNNRVKKDRARIHIIIEESLCSILEIGVACSAELRGERLDISYAMAEMSEIRNE